MKPKHPSNAALHRCSKPRRCCAWVRVSLFCKSVETRDDQARIVISSSAFSRQVRAAQARGQPYTIVFVGVNGVGKSTNLAKIAYWLLQNDVKVGLPEHE